MELFTLNRLYFIDFGLKVLAGVKPYPHPYVDFNSKDFIACLASTRKISAFDSSKT